MEAIYIPQLLKAPQQTEAIQVDEFLPDLETLTPVRGKIQVQHRGNFLNVSGQTETILTLTCHRCLKQYNHRLKVNTSEIIWLDPAANQPDEGPVEREVAVEDLVETLPPDGYFDPGEWLYQQLCLEIPQRQLCDAMCTGIEPAAPETSAQSVDSRWASLEALKK
ncbi:MAG TPA: metal-binding protein, partial [Cyanobacteria bacterium UBA11049]|nr:metal-binding protein [Cyanobacteria bacterium UBA11049]